MARIKRLPQLLALTIFAMALSAFVLKESPASALRETAGGDWPQWRGPNRDGISTETGLLKTWPASGPKVLWRAASGEGYAGISVANGRAYTMYSDGSQEVVVCLDAGTGKELWRYKASPAFRNDQGDGTRSTPTVDGDLVFTLSANGMLTALNAATGAKVWQHQIRDEFGGRVPTWGISTTPLVEGEKLIVDVGGKSGHSVIAFNKKNGSIIWKSETDIPGYSAPIAVNVNGVRQILIFTGSGLASFSPANGKRFWHFPWETSYDVNAATPVFIAPDKVFISSGYGVGGALLQISGSNGSSSVNQVWKSREMKNHFSSSILYQNHLYGFDDAFLTCLDVATGKPKWQQRGFQKGSLLFADGHLIVLGERGLLALVEASPEGYKEKAQFQVLQGKCWTMPTLANGKLYVRNQREMLCLEVAGKM